MSKKKLQPVASQAHRVWAARSPVYARGERVLCYSDDESGTIMGPAKRLGYWSVMLDADGGTLAQVGWDNIVRMPV